MSKEAVATTEASLRSESEQISKKMFGATNDDAWRKLQKRSDFEGACHCGGHVGLVVLFGYLQYTLKVSPPTDLLSLSLCDYLSALLITAQSMCMAFMFTGFHEMTHRTAFATNILSDSIGHMFGFIIFRPLRHYTYYHYNHHKFTGDPARDPELQDSFIDLKLDNVFAYIVYLSAVPYWVDRLSTLFRHGVLGWVLPREEAFLSKLTKPMMLAEARLYVGLYFALLVYAMFGGGDYINDSYSFGYVLWRIWILPTLIAQPFLRWYLVGEHTGCPNGDNMLSNTRTTKTYGWYRWLAWNMPYHAEHHAYPYVPFHHLPALHKHLTQRQGDTHRHCDPNGEHGYLGVHIGIIKKFLGMKKVD